MRARRGDSASRWSASLTSAPSSAASVLGVGGVGRLVDEHGAVVGAQPGLGDRLHLLGGDVQDALHGGQRELRVAEQDGEAAQFVGAAADRGRAGPATRAPAGPARAPSPPAVGPSSAKRASSSSTARLDAGDLDAAGRLHVQPAQRGRAGQPQQAEAGRDGACGRAAPAGCTGGRTRRRPGRSAPGPRRRLAGAVVRQPVGGHQGAGGHLLLDDLAQLLADDVGQRAVARRRACRRAPGIEPKYFSTQASVCSGSMSPTIDSTALLGA